MAEDVFQSFMVALGFDVNASSLNTAKKSIADYEQAVKDAEKRIEDARWAGAKTEEEVAKLARETNLKEARAALGAAQDKEKVEKEQARKREERHKEFIAGMSRVALAASAMATAVSYAVNRVTQSFDNLGFTSARTGASVQSLKSIGYAFSQVGGSSQQAIGAVEKFAAALRQNDGLKSYVASLGVDTTKDMADQLLDTVDALSKHPYQVGSREAGMLGISEEDYKLLTQYAAKVKEYRAEYDAMTKALGVNSEQAAAASQSFQRSLTRLQATSAALSDRLMTSLAPALEAIVARFNKFIADNPEVVNTILRTTADGIIWITDKIQAMVEWFASDHGKMFIDRWNDFADRVAAIGHAFETVWAVLKKIDEWLHLSSIYSFIDKLGTLVLSGRFGLGGAIQDALGVGGGGSGDSSGARPRDDRRWYEKILPKGMGGRDAPTADAGDGMGARARRGLGRLARSVNVQAIVGELRQAGYGNNAIAAVVGSMETESTFNPRAANNQSGGHTGLWQWDRNRWPKIKNWIQSQGGDPYDAAWQTKAWIAEHNAKPGDPIYDHPRTARGGAILRDNPTIEDAIHGVRESERFGPREEGGRARHAREWLPQMAPGGALSGKPDLRPIIVAPPPAAAMRGLPNMTPAGFDPNRIDPKNVMQPAPVGASPVTNNSTSSSSRSLTQHNSFKVDITGSQTPREHADAFTK
ncbi:phage tail tip lysozyme, partial [Methylobacterium sp. J-030]|uniref:phage tail tip lysozyme n=1 Tax=Methylobacterium sp. J-030 TaxID=2836627 RepID=UPI001FBBEF6D